MCPIERTSCPGGPFHLLQIGRTRLPARHRRPKRGLRMAKRMIEEASKREPDAETTCTGSRSGKAGVVCVGRFSAALDLRGAIRTACLLFRV